MATSTTEAVSVFQTEWADTMDCFAGRHFLQDKMRLQERICLQTANDLPHITGRWISLYQQHMEQA